MTDAELSRLKRLLADIEAVNPQTTFYDVARETLRWRIEGEERKRAEVLNSFVLMGRNSTLMGRNSTLMGRNSTLMGRNYTIMGRNYTIMGRNYTVVY